MNKIDIDFSCLVKTIKEMEKEELFYRMKENLFKIPLATQKSLEDYFEKFDYWGSLNIEKKDFDFLRQRANSIYEHIDDLVWFYQRLKDYRSKYVLFSIISNALYFDFRNLKNCTEYAYGHYFDLDIYPQAKNEVFVDIGSYTGDTVLEFINWYGDESYKKIYCFEITPSIIELSKNNLKKFKNIEFCNCAVGSCEGKTFINPSNIDPSANQTGKSGEKEIEVKTLDNLVKEKITSIKMDIEGGEKEAIKGAKKHIKNDSPLLMIAVYHKHNDIWEIPKMIEEINSNYDFYLRYNGGCIFPTETTLICKVKD